MINLYPYFYQLVTVDFVHKALILSQCDNNNNMKIIYFSKLFYKNRVLMIVLLLIEGLFTSFTGKLDLRKVFIRIQFLLKCKVVESAIIFLINCASFNNQRRKHYNYSPQHSSIIIKSSSFKQAVNNCSLIKRRNSDSILIVLVFQPSCFLNLFNNFEVIRKLVIAYLKTSPTSAMPYIFA